MRAKSLIYTLFCIVAFSLASFSVYAQNPNQPKDSTGIDLPNPTARSYVCTGFQIYETYTTTYWRSSCGMYCMRSCNGNDVVIGGHSVYEDADWWVAFRCGKVRPVCQWQ